MYRFLLKPRWIAFHVLVVVAVVIMINLGFWQLRRLHERQDFNALVRDNTNLPIAPIGEVLTQHADNDSLEWRRVEVTGSYLPDAQVEVVNRSQGGEPGRNVVVPLLLADGTVLLVNRGFVPSSQDIPQPPGGDVMLVGRLRESEERRLGQGSDDASAVLTEVRRLDIDVLASQVGGPVQPMFLQLLTSSPPEPAYPEPVTLPTLGEGPHLGYMVQWFIFSVAVAVGWVFAVRRSAVTRNGTRPQKRRRGPPPIADELSRV